MTDAGARDRSSEWREPHPPWIVGHRGAPRRARENTIESFDWAESIGVDAVEFDLRQTRDGEAQDEPTDVLRFHVGETNRGLQTPQKGAWMNAPIVRRLAPRGCGPRRANHSVHIGKAQ